MRIRDARAERPLRTRTTVVTAVLLALLGSGLTIAALADPVGAREAARCTTFRDDAVWRRAHPTGTGADVLVIGDSWSVGLGLPDLDRSWPSRLPGHVVVAGFSGSGFSATASDCGRRYSFAQRAPSALRLVGPHATVVVEGGLNDVDQSDAAVIGGFGRLMRVLHGRDVVVVGPAAAPRRAARVGRVEALLQTLCEERGIPYVATSDLVLPYQQDRLHLTDAGQQRFGDVVAARIAATQNR